ncbi:ImmA/IrrE family metallo-endopeptidase [Candidatus Saccharibacteria bacterium]|nr:ImmA/IrrE family metallo-endopeptidase [Candidatus Saccharibacteria bacterium]
MNNLVRSAGQNNLAGPAKSASGGSASKISTTTKKFINDLTKDYPGFKIERGKQEHWSPKNNTISFNPDQTPERIRFGILHELAHALLGHATYQSDFELLKMESEAWHLASKIGIKYGVTISEDHIQNCLDTYRDWLHRRSQCPACSMHVLQDSASIYKCFNCASVWQVSSARFVRPYRKSHK